MFYLHKVPKWYQYLRPDCHWNLKQNQSSKKIAYLTFDDGPIPTLTPWVLDCLDSYKVKGTFFCVGDNISKHPKLFKQLVNKGHAIGNHTFNHLNASRVPQNAYLENIKLCDALINPYVSDRKIFRPPYGRISARIIEDLKEDYEIIMWDYLTADFDQSLSSDKCLSRAIKGVKDGSIITFHDNLKAEKNLKYTLPRLIDYLLDKNFMFRTISFSN